MQTIASLRAALAASPVPFTFLAPPGRRFAPIYLAAGERLGRLGSVNAGNSNAFFVGGGGLNAAFAAALAQPAAYLPLQTALYQSASGRTATAAYPAAQPVRFALVQRPAAGQAFFDYEGTIFVDVFQPATVPAGNPENYAMIYVCPPNGANYAAPAPFLAAAEATALNLVTAVALYNTQCAPTVPGLATVEWLRVFLFSSSIYRQEGTSVAQVAQAVCSGLLAGLAAGPSGLTGIQLPNASGEYAAVAAG